MKRFPAERKLNSCKGVNEEVEILCGCRTACLEVLIAIVGSPQFDEDDIDSGKPSRKFLYLWTHEYLRMIQWILGYLCDCHEYYQFDQLTAVLCSQI